MRRFDEKKKPQYKGRKHWKFNWCRNHHKNEHGHSKGLTKEKKTPKPPHLKKKTNLIVFANGMSNTNRMLLVYTLAGAKPTAMITNDAQKDYGWVFNHSIGNYVLCKNDLDGFFCSLFFLQKQKHFSLSFIIATNKKRRCICCDSFSIHVN